MRMFTKESLERSRKRHFQEIKKKEKQLDYENMSIQIDAKNKTLVIPSSGVTAQDFFNFLETNPKYREWKIRGEEEV
jgi:hypothetical protein